MLSFVRTGWLSAALLLPAASLAGCALTSDDYVVNAAIWGSPEGDLFVAGYEGDSEVGFVKKRVGEDWVALRESQPPLWGIWGTSSNDLFVFGGFGQSDVLRFRQDAWQAWELSGTWTGKADPTIRGIWGAAANDVFVVGRQGIVAHFDGAGWVSMDAQTTVELAAVWGSSGSDVFAVGEGGTIVHYDGSSWTRQASPSIADLNDIWGSSASNIFAVGETVSEQSHVILHYNGNEWTVVHEGQIALLGIHGISPDCVYTVGARRNGKAIESGVFFFDGVSWTRQSGDAGEFLWDVWVTPDCGYVAVGPNDTIVQKH